MKTVYSIDMTGNPLLLLSAFSIMIGVLFFGMGMLGELGARIYYSARGMQPYSIRNQFGTEKEVPSLNKYNIITASNDDPDFSNPDIPDRDDHRKAV